MAESRKIVDHLLFLGESQVDAALDGSVLVDLGQGNFNHAKIAAEQALKKQRDADTLFARGVVHQLQGEYGQALRQFETVFNISSDPQNQFIIASMAYLAERQRGDILPDGFSLDFEEAQQRWGRYTENSQWLKRRHALHQQVNSPDAFFAGEFIYHVSAMLPTYRSVIWGLTDEKRTEHLRKIEEHLTQLLQRAQHFGAFFITGAIYSSLAELFAIGGKVEQAFRVFENLTNDCRKSENALGIAWCLMSQGDLLASPDPLGKPILFGYHLQDSTTDTTVAANSQLFDRSGIDRARARTFYREAQQYFDATKAPRGEGMVLLRLAYLDATAGEWQQAAESYEKGRQNFVATGDRLNEMAAEAGLLWTSIQLGKPERKLKAQVKDLASIAKDNEAIAQGLSWGLTFAYGGRDALSTRGDVEVALRSAHLAKTIFEVFDTPLRQAQIYSDRADALAILEDFEASLVEMEKALVCLQQVAQGSKPRVLTAKVMGIQLALSIVKGATGQYDAGILERTLKKVPIFVNGIPSLSPAEQQALVESDPMTFNSVEIEAFLEYHHKLNLLFIHETARLIEDEVKFYAPFGRGMKAIEAGKEAESEQEFTAALAQTRGHPEANFRQGMVFAGWRRYPEALRVLRDYLAQGMPQDTNLLQEIQFKLNPKQAEVEARQRQIGIRWQIVALFITIKAWKDAQQQLNEIEVFIGQPKPLVQVPTRDDILQRSYYGLVAEGLGNPQSAQKYLKEAVEGMEARRRYLRQERLRRAFGSQRTTLALYFDLARILTKIGDWETAFEVAEKTRARVLSEALGESKAAIRKLKNSSLFRQYMEQTAVVERLITQLTLARRREDSQRERDLQNQLQKATNKLDTCEFNLSQVEPGWRSLFAPQVETFSLNQVAAFLPRGTLLLAYLFLSDCLLTWAVTRDGLVGHYSLNKFDGQPFDARPFGARIRQWSNTWNESNNLVEPFETTFGNLLAQSLIKPFDKQIALANHLLILPFAELNLLSFGALPWGDRPLGLQKSISYLPGVSLLKYFRPSDPQAKGTLIVGNPVGMSYKDIEANQMVTLVPIPGTRGGSELIAKRYGVQPLIGSQATEKAVRSGIALHPKIIHLFTHGYLQPNVPLASGVALANGEALSADEFMGLEIKADVVILSACVTGQGKLQGSELIGLARSIIYAGAQAVIVSLWDANDIANAMLMQFLHHKLLEDKSIAQSLEQAQEQLSQVTAQEALDFCRAIQAPIPRHNDVDWADRAILTGYMGYVMERGGDYTKATRAYQIAIKNLSVLSHYAYRKNLKEMQKKLENQYRRCRLLARRPHAFNPSKLIFNSSKYWASFEIIGDWQ